MTLTEQNAILKAAILGLRGMAVLEATRDNAWGMAVQQIDDVLVKIGLDAGMLDDSEDYKRVAAEERIAAGYPRAGDM